MKNGGSFLERYIKKLSGSIVVLLLLFFGALLLFGYITHEVLWEQEEAVDLRIFRFLSVNVISPGLTPVMKGVTYFASATFLQITYVALVVVFLFRQSWKRAIEITTIGLGGYTVNYFMKWFFHRPRPANPLIDPLTNFSFPSGHAMSGFIFYGLLTYLVWKTDLPKPYKYVVGGVLILFALLIGFSRIYLRLHYPSDVVAGFCIGFAWLALSIWIMERMKKRSNIELKAERSEAH